MLARKVGGSSARVVSVLLKEEGRVGLVQSLRTVPRTEVRRRTLVHTSTQSRRISRQSAQRFERSAGSKALYSTQTSLSGLAWAEGPNEVCYSLSTHSRASQFEKTFLYG